MRKKGLIKTLIRLLKMSKGSGPKLVFSIILAAITSVLTLLIPYFFGKIVDLLTDDVDMREVLTYLLFILSFIVITSVLTYIMNTLNYMISYDTVKRLRDSAYEKINRLPVSYIEKTSVGSVESLIINDCETVSDGLLVSLNQFFTGLITIIVVFVIMFVINTSFMCDSLKASSSLSLQRAPRGPACQGAGLTWMRRQSGKEERCL